MLYKLQDLQPGQILPPGTIPVGPTQAMVPYTCTFDIEEVEKSIKLVAGGSYLIGGPAQKLVLQAAEAMVHIFKQVKLDF